jgi:hypothetical protein
MAPQVGVRGSLKRLTAVANVINAPALTMRRNGTQWTVIPNPSQATLYGVAALAPNDIWSVGSYTDGTQWLTWIDR